MQGSPYPEKKGVLYGNGNILGYRLVKGSKSSENTYEVIEEDAETVRMVYDFYLEGMGVKTIAAKMQELHRQTAKSGCKWDATKVLRILDNKTYAGYIGYHKSHTTSFLDHARVPVKDRSLYEYVKGDFPAIIPEEKWNRVQSMKRKKVTCAGQGKYGKKRSKDRWVRVLVCECGRTYHKYKWRVNKSGEECCGYQCWNQVNNRRKSFRVKNGLDAEGYCDVPSICEWKLDFMLKHILHQIWKNPKGTITALTETIKESYVRGQESNTESECLKRELERLKCRKERLLDMRLDNQIEESAFEEKRKQIQERTAEIEKRMEASREQEVAESTEDISSAIQKVKDVLENACNLEQKKIDGNLIEVLVERVMPTEEGVFKWYLNCKTIEEEAFDEKEYTLYDSFCLCFEEAKAYRKQYGNFIRANQWRDLQVEIYIAK